MCGCVSESERERVSVSVGRIKREDHHSQW